MTDETRPAFYAAAAGGWRDWWTLLHPPYTAWNLAYVTIGCALAPRLDVGRLVLILAAFFLGLGVSAHALDELNGRPLRTGLSDGVLKAAAALGLVGAVTLGISGVTGVALGIARTTAVGGKLVPFIGVAVFGVLTYNLEWFGGRLHTDAAFAAFWGAFPVLSGYFVQAERLDAVAVIAALAAFALSRAQRTLSARARFMRRDVSAVRAELELSDGSIGGMDKAEMLVPLDASLHALSWSIVLLAAALVASRLST
ncbi:MAG: hypothetical protein H0U16_04755 [Actinobacteria bacterium]|nr:hypothetical protein [Actinomycetota bacterium]